MFILGGKAQTCTATLGNTDREETMDDNRLIGLIAFLRVYHSGGFVNQTIQKDELLSVLEELQAFRIHSASRVEEPAD
jgi:hypothetical protein